MAHEIMREYELVIVKFRLLKIQCTHHNANILTCLFDRTNLYCLIASDLPHRDIIHSIALFTAINTRGLVYYTDTDIPTCTLLRSVYANGR